ncbi:MAG: PDDEXK nuclease domain-containing protein [Balneolales bacterium]|nr:PDDEXK nuclease domain-containing protein [Balneolales bacterium]
MEKDYSIFLGEIKSHILQSRYKAAAAVNRELILLYFQVGTQLSQKIAHAQWGSKVVLQLANDLQKEINGLRGFSYRNLMNMRAFAEAYPFLQSVTAEFKNDPIGQLANTQLKDFSQSVTGQMDALENEFLQLATAEFESWDSFLSEVFFNISFTQHLLLLNKCKEVEERLFYMQKAAALQWTVALLEHHIESDLYRQKGTLQNNFKQALPPKLHKNAIDAFKGEYLLDFIRIEEEDDERILESRIVQNIKKFILSMGHDFAFMGNQYRLKVEEEEFFIDLLFFHRKLQSLVAIELKQGKFKAEYAGKMNLYLSALDEYVKQDHENPSIGIILCKSKNSKVVEFAFRDMNKAMGVATFKTSRELPAGYKGILPNSEELKKILDDDNQ